MPNIFIFGDSIAFGFYDGKGGWAERIKKSIDEKNYKDISGQTLFYNLSISGNTAMDLLERLVGEIHPRIDENKENIILFAIGINDSQYRTFEKERRFCADEFKANLSNLLSISRRYSNKIGFVGLTAIDQPKVDPAPWAPEAAYRVHYVEEFNTIIKKMCKSQHISFINVYDEFTKKGHKKLLRDGLHPNSKGHELLAELIRPFFEKFKVL